MWDGFAHQFLGLKQAIARNDQSDIPRQQYLELIKKRTFTKLFHSQFYLGPGKKPGSENRTEPDLKK